MTTLPDFTYPARELLHVYGADVTGHGGDDYYAFEWGQIDPFAGTGSYANGDRKTGRIGAGHYTTSGWLHAHAGVGIRIVPKTGVGELSVQAVRQLVWQRPVAAPRVRPAAWGTAVGRGDRQPRHHRAKPPCVGRRLQDRRDLLAGSVAPCAAQPTGCRRLRRHRQRGHRPHPRRPGQLDSQLRRLGRLPGGGLADPGFAVATRTGAAINCAIPFLVVQEVPA